MNERTISTLKKVRAGLQMAYEPVDRLTRFVNRKQGYPPLYLRQKVGSLNDFEASGAEYMVYLKQLCGLRPRMNVLDVGCGCGLMCLRVNENPTLPDYIYPGEYVGLDTDLEAISWCTKHLSNNTTRFYGLTDTKGFKFKEDHGRFDVVLCKSLFTHLEPVEVVSYVQEISKLLQQGGRCLTTFFILLPNVERAGRYRFEEWDERMVDADDKPSNPRAAKAYTEAWLRMVFANAGLSCNFYFGSWRGDNKGLSFQDIIILTR